MYELGAEVHDQPHEPKSYWYEGHRHEVQRDMVCKSRTTDTDGENMAGRPSSYGDRR